VPPLELPTGQVRYSAVWVPTANTADSQENVIRSKMISLRQRESRNELTAIEDHFFPGCFFQGEGGTNNRKKRVSGSASTCGTDSGVRSVEGGRQLQKQLAMPTVPTLANTQRSLFLGLGKRVICAMLIGAGSAKRWQNECRMPVWTSNRIYT